MTRPRWVSLAVLLCLPGIILLVPKEELAGVSLQVLILGPLSVSALWVRKHPDTKCHDGWRASVLYLDSLGYCCRFCAKQIKDYKQSGRVVLKGHERTKNRRILTQIGCFWTLPVSIPPRLWNDAQSLKQHRGGALLFFEVIRQISRSFGTKIANFERNWAFPDCNSSLNSLMAMKWCTKLDIVEKRCPIVFLGHPSNFKITWAEKSMFWILFVYDY